MQDDLPVLIEGESGTGKEVIGRFLHKHSVRGDGPFVKFNCAAVSARLLEREMFGYEKSGRQYAGDAVAGSIGVAWGGTLFLDEIQDMDLSMQEKLTRTLRSGQYRRDGRRGGPGCERPLCVRHEFRPEGGVAESYVSRRLMGCFAHHHLHLLPLRERKEDIPGLCEYLLEKFARDFGRPVPHLSSNVLEAFQQWKWPGNVRELENWIARIVIFGAEEVIGLQFSRQLAVGEQPALAICSRRSHEIWPGKAVSSDTDEVTSESVGQISGFNGLKRGTDQKVTNWRFR